jgi:hypothetical protein
MVPSSFQCAPSNLQPAKADAKGDELLKRFAENREDFPSNLQQLVDDKEVSAQDRLHILTCIATHEHDRRVQAEQDLWLYAIQLTAAQRGTDADSAKVQDEVQSLRAAVLTLVASQAPQDVGTLKTELDNLKGTVAALCSAIRFSLAMNGTSATSSGGALWNACSNQN